MKCVTTNSLYVSRCSSPMAFFDKVCWKYNCLLLVNFI